MRGFVPKKPKHRRLRGDWSLKKTKTIWRTQVRKFHFASICNVLPCELRLFWYSTRFLNRHLADKLPTCGQQSATNGQHSADYWQKIFVKAVNDSWPTVGRLSADYRPTIGRLSADSWPTVGRLSSDCWPTVGRQFFGGAVLHFFLISY